MHAAKSFFKSLPVKSTLFLMKKTAHLQSGKIAELAEKNPSTNTNESEENGKNALETSISAVESLLAKRMAYKILEKQHETGVLFGSKT